MGRKDSFSKLKYQERMLSEINILLRRDLSDPRLKDVTVTRVELTSDYSYGTIYWDTHNTGIRGDIKTAISKLAPKVRSQLASLLKVRHVPSLTFVYDSQFEDEHNIMSLIHPNKKS